MTNDQYWTKVSPPKYGVAVFLAQALPTFLPRTIPLGQSGVGTWVLYDRDEFVIRYWSILIVIELGL